MKRTTPAIALLGLICACTTHGRETEVRWFHSGFYVGALAGVSDLDSTGNDIDFELSKLGYATSTDLDEDDFAYSFLAGYRFEAPFAIEAGYMNLGEADSDIDAMPVNQSNFLDDVRDVHPFLGDGYFIMGRFYPLDGERLHVGIGGGAWYWEADLDVDATGGGHVSSDEDGFDPIFGINVLYDLNDHVSLRAQWDHVWLDDYEADVLTAGLQIHLGRPSASRRHADRVALSPYRY